MRSTQLLLISVLVFAAPNSSWAGYEEGEAAYEKGHYDIALQELLPLAQQGNADAQTLVANMYFEGKGVPQDYEEAEKWYRMAAEQGDAYGQYNLALMYDNGWGVPKDPEKASHWYYEAAKKNSPFAQNNLAFMYQYGRGVPKDRARAYFLYAAAAFQFSLKAGYENYRNLAAENRDNLARSMSKEQLETAYRMGAEWLGIEVPRESGHE